ncbi:hypothetical protein QEV83_09945 [Methylocapsa sp. D3K7]|uniref:hypothetical protein n=1 Tax=Methylocapsa sp. D3K7 TaxID=3041435 RepID=UPI00244EE06D|nr:hypothetical protein [Methylocapsa sp. D3K7]WGJ13055.1 hypothetical protein QEV83_09945 [Methylocapsa sp. D3K7]
MRNFPRRFFFTAGAAALGCAFWATPSFADPGRGANVMCYAWANNASPTINVPYEPSPTYSFNAQNRAGGISVTKTATGTYTVTCTGVGGGSQWGAGGHVQVSAYGFGNNGSCHVAGWGTGGADFSATVNCYGGGGTGGVLKDSAFDLLFVW